MNRQTKQAHARLLRVSHASRQLIPIQIHGDFMHTPIHLVLKYTRTWMLQIPVLKQIQRIRTSSHRIGQASLKKKKKLSTKIKCQTQFYTKDFVRWLDSQHSVPNMLHFLKMTSDNFIFQAKKVSSWILEVRLFFFFFYYRAS